MFFTNRKIELVVLLCLALVLALTACRSRSTESSDSGSVDDSYSDPTSRGFDESFQRNMDDVVEREFKSLRSLVIVRNDEIVFEKNEDSSFLDQQSNVYSVTKSVTSMLIGIALQRGEIDSIDQTVADFFPEEAMLNPDLREISLRHLLAMSSGLAGGEEFANRWRGANLKLSWALEQPLVVEPGTEYYYFGANSQLLIGVLQKATGIDVEAYAEAHLFGPLEITSYGWRTDSEGNNLGGRGLSLSPRDLLKLGQLYLNDGEWDGEHIVSAEWVAESTSYVMAPNGEQEMGYGLHWWVWDEERTVYAAIGYGGQYVFVIPQLELVGVMITGTRFGGAFLDIQPLLDGIYRSVDE